MHFAIGIQLLDCLSRIDQLVNLWFAVCHITGPDF